MPGVQEDPRAAGPAPPQLSPPPEPQGPPPDPDEGLPRWNLVVGYHLQAVMVLILLLLGFWGLWRVAVPAISDALNGPYAAVVIESGDEILDPTGEAPLTIAEVADLQTALAEAGYDPGPIDGIMGERTRKAAAEARAVLNLQQESDRRLLEVLTLAAEQSEPTPGQ